MSRAISSLTVAQREFAELHGVGYIEGSFMLDNVFMYHDHGTFTDRWLVRPDGSTANHDRFSRRQ